MGSTTTRTLGFFARNACMESAIVQVAAKLGVFASLARAEPRGLSAPALAASIGASVRGVRSLLEPLAGMEFVRVTERDRFALEPAFAESLLDPAMVDELSLARRWWHPVGQLSAAVQGDGTVSHEGRSWDVLHRFREILLGDGPPAEGPTEEVRDRGVRHAMRTAALIAAFRTGLLVRVVSGEEAPVLALARELDISENGVQLLLEVLERLGVVRPVGQTWTATEDGRALKSGGSVEYLCRALAITELYWEALGALEETIEHERFVLDLKDPSISARFYSQNALEITNVFRAHFSIGRRAAATVQAVRSLAGAQVLDIGTGSGVWAAAFGRTEPTARLTLLDQPDVLDRARDNLRRLRLADRATFWPGNCTQVDYGTDAWDVIILPQVLNALRPESLSDLFERLARALRPGGLLVVVEYVLGDHRDRPLDYLCFGFRRFLTNEGDLYSRAEYDEMLKAVGLGHTALYRLPAQEMILAAAQPTVFPADLVALPPPPQQG